MRLLFYFGCKTAQKIIKNLEKLYKIACKISIFMLEYEKTSGGPLKNSNEHRVIMEV